MSQDSGHRTLYKGHRIRKCIGFSAVADITVDEDKRHKKQDSGFK